MSTRWDGNEEPPAFTLGDCVCSAAAAAVAWALVGFFASVHDWWAVAVALAFGLVALGVTVVQAVRYGRQVEQLNQLRRLNRKVPFTQVHGTPIELTHTRRPTRK